MDASRGGVACSDGGTARPRAVTTGTKSVAGQASAFARPTRFTRSVLVNGAPGLITHAGGRPPAVMPFVTAGDRMARIDILTDPDRLARLSAVWG